MTLLRGGGREAMRDAHKTLYQISCHGNNSRELFEIELWTYLFCINPLFGALFDCDFFSFLKLYFFFLAIKYLIDSNFFSTIITTYFKTITTTQLLIAPFHIPRTGWKTARLQIVFCLKQLRSSKGGQICEPPIFRAFNKIWKPETPISWVARQRSPHLL